LGNCHQFSFTLTEDVTGWYAGIVWQYPQGNWGELPGLNVQPGATAVRFRAWGSVGGEQVYFNAASTKTPCSDEVQLTPRLLTLTTTPSNYDLDLGGQTYESGIITGFAWSIGTIPQGQPLVFYVDNIRWAP
jgi:hypothetical protein